MEVVERNAERNGREVRQQAEDAAVSDQLVPRVRVEADQRGQAKREDILRRLVA